MSRPAIVCGQCAREVQPGEKVFRTQAGEIRHDACRAGVVWTCTVHRFTTANREAWTAHRATCAVSELYARTEAAADPVERCAICRRRFREGDRYGAHSDGGIVHEGCADALAVAESIVRAWWGAMIDTRRPDILPEERAHFIELAMTKARDDITTAIIGAGNPRKGS